MSATRVRSDRLAPEASGHVPSPRRAGPGSVQQSLDPWPVQRLVGNHALSGLLAPGQSGGGSEACSGSAALRAAIADSGAALDPVTRATMEGLLGHDLSRVRIHGGAAAAASARRLDARAYTIGDDIVLGDSVPPLGSRAGRQALGHELIHVVQQRLGGSTAGADVETPFEREAEIAAVALADARTPPRVVRGTAVGVARQPMDPRHARGHAGEQGMGFTHYRQEDGWIFFEGPSGSGGHGVTQAGFDGVAYNLRTGEIHIIDNKSLAATGNVRSATAIDPTRNLGKNVDGMIERVEAAKDVPGRVRLLGRLRALKASLAAGKPPPDDVKLVVTSVGGRTTDVSPRLKAAGVQHLPDPPPKASPTAKTTSTLTQPPVPKPTPEAVPAPVPKPTPEAVPAPVPKPTLTATPVVAPPVRPTSAWRAGLKAGGKALVWALIFAGLDYWVHKQLEKDLEESIDKARTGALPWAQRIKREDPSKPVYMRVKVRSEEYSRYIPLLGWMPESPRLFLSQIAMVRDEIDPPIVVLEDHRLNVWRPGTSTEVTYTEPMVP